MFAATAVLACLAKKQMKTLAAQAQAAQDQVKAAQDQVEIMRQSSAEEATAVEKEITASIEQGKAIREAARAQLQPIVFAHGDQLHRGPDDEYDLHQGMVGFGYRLANEGTGLALNIRHGIEINGRKVLVFEEGISRSLRSGEWQPPPDDLDDIRGLIRIRPLVVACPEHQLPEGWEKHPLYFWAMFSNVFGERFLTRNPSDPTLPAEFRTNEGEVMPSSQARP